MEVKSYLYHRIVLNKTLHCLSLGLRECLWASIIFSTWHTRGTSVIMIKHKTVVTVQIYTLIFSFAYLHFSIHVTILSNEFKLSSLPELITDVLETIIIDGWNDEDSLLSQQAGIEIVFMDVTMQDS